MAKTKTMAKKSAGTGSTGRKKAGGAKSGAAARPVASPEQGAAAHLAYLVAEESALAILPHLPVSAVHPHYTLVTRERVDGWHGAGLAVFTWTVNDGELAARMLEAGVDGIIGDEPQVLLDAVAVRS